MDPFEFVFALFGLLLGLSLAVVLGGLGHIAKASALGAASRPERIGYLAPLLGVIVMFATVAFWNSAWAAREIIPVSMPSLLLGLLLNGVFYFAAILVFPDDMDAHTDLDAHYLAVKTKVTGAVIACSVIVNAILFATGIFYGWDRFAASAVLILVWVHVLIARGPRWNLTALVITTGFYLVMAALTLAEVYTPTSAPHLADAAAPHR